MILPKIRDNRFITIRRGGTLTDEDHRMLTVWAAQCANHVLHYFKEVRPNDDRPRRANGAAYAWVNGEMKMMQARDAAGAAQNAAREVKGVSGREDGGSVGRSSSDGGSCRRPRAGSGSLRDPGSYGGFT